MRAHQQGYVGQREIQVRKDEILEKIKENKEKHVEQFKVSMEGFHNARLSALKHARELIDTAIQRLEAHTDFMTPPSLTLSADDVHIGINHQVPQSHETDYTQVIAMLEMETRPEIMVTGAEFACFGQDDWDWKQDFEVSNMKYAGFAGR